MSASVGEGLRVDQGVQCLNVVSVRIGTDLVIGFICLYVICFWIDGE